MTMRTCLIGLGRVSPHIIAALQSLPGLELTCAVDTDETKLRRAGAGVTTFSSVGDFITSGGADVAIVATPNDTHYPITQALISAGVPTIIEKPATVSMRQFQELRRHSEECDVPVCVIFHSMYGAEVQWFVAKACERAFGDWGRIAAFYSEFADPYVGKTGGPHPGIESLSGSWLDSGVNALSILELIFADSRMSVRHHRETRNIGLFSGVVTSITIVDIAPGPSVSAVAGVIVTDWTSQRDDKFTELHFERDDRCIVLDHVRGRVVRATGEDQQVVFECEDARMRMTRHYTKGLASMLDLIRQRRGNLDFAQRVHETLFAASSAAEDPLSRPLSLRDLARYRRHWDR